MSAAGAGRSPGTGAFAPKGSPKACDWPGRTQRRSRSRGTRTARGERVENPEETDDLLRLGLHRLPIGDFPLLRSLAPVLASYDGRAELERGLDILLTGLTATLPAAART
jgi:hypothetical protein